MLNVSIEHQNILEGLKELYIFGSKGLGLELLEKLGGKEQGGLGLKIKGFIDNNKNVVGETINGVEVFSLEQIEDKTSAIVIASISYMYEIEEQLKDKGFENIIPFSLLTLHYSQFAKFNQAFDGLHQDYVENKKEYDALYNLFDDEISIQTLDTLIEYRKTYKTDLFSKVNKGIENQYFENFLNNNFEIFVDGGGFDGDTAEKFIKFNPNYKKIYLLEPDEISLNKAKENLKNYKNIEFLPFGVSDCNKTLKFDTRGDLGSLFCENGDVEIKCISLDEIVKEDKCFIKLDIEGAETDALNGAKRLIKNGSQLAICVYHKPSDVWKIPELILSLNPNYKFYLKHYTTCIFDTVLYAIPLFP